MFISRLHRVLAAIVAAAWCAGAPAQATQHASGAVPNVVAAPARPSHAPATESVLYRFCPKPTCPDGQNPEAGLIADSTGAVYGTSVQGGSSGPYGTVFKLTHHGSNYMERVLYSFCSRARCDDGLAPHAAPILDSKGDLFGTTSSGGDLNSGTVFKLTRHGETYVESVVHSFCAQFNCADEANPLGGLVEDAEGALYGTTSTRGVNGYGTLYKLTPRGSAYTFSVIYSFCSRPHCTDGGFSTSRLIADASGSLYGTTSAGGLNFFGGTVFELMRRGSSYEERVLYNFCSMAALSCIDGAGPNGDLLVDRAGALYGTTGIGGTSKNVLGGAGTVFKLTPRAGAYEESVLYSFCSHCGCSDGGGPLAGVTAYAGGVLVGTTGYGGTSANIAGGGGTAFALTPHGSGYRERVIYDFCAQPMCSDGYEPYAGLIVDPTGILFGTTVDGGNSHNWGTPGTIFKLVP